MGRNRFKPRIDTQNLISHIYSGMDCPYARSWCFSTSRMTLYFMTTKQFDSPSEYPVDNSNVPHFICSAIWVNLPTKFMLTCWWPHCGPKSPPHAHPPKQSGLSHLPQNHPLQLLQNPILDKKITPFASITLRFFFLFVFSFSLRLSFFLQSFQFSLCVLTAKGSCLLYYYLFSLFLFCLKNPFLVLI